MMTTDEEAWRRRGLAMATLLRPELPDGDWEDALRVICAVAEAAKTPAAAVIARRASGAGSSEALGLAVRRDACRKLLAALADKPKGRVAA